jgi:hypothetical protein
VSVLSHTRALLVVIFLLTQSGVVFAQIEGIGFQARLDMRSTVVSPYTDPDNRFSAATYPLSYTTLSSRLLYTPKVEDGNFDNDALSFSTEISRNVDLVPVSVDARKYHDRRVRTSIDNRWSGFAANTVDQSKQGGGRGGLSIGLDLPKRFDQMFGEGGANLRVSGNRRITFSGRSQWDDAARSGIRKQSKFPALNMEQVSRFTIQGTIGTKISVSVTQDNQTDIPLANRLILRYKGDEDDVLKTIEAGNTNLSISNTQFVGYSQHIQGLFGLKTEAQLGNLKLTAIASQEKGSSESARVSATGEENADYTRDYNYVMGRIFDLASHGEIGPNDSVRVYVYEFESRTDNHETEQTYLQADTIPNPSYDVSGLSMKEVADDQWELLYGQDTSHCPVALVFYTERNQALGVRMEITRFDSNSVATGEVTTIGYTGPGTDTLRIIQMPYGTQSPDHPSWKLMWRNCYRIPRNVSIEDIDVKVYKGYTAGASSNYDYQTAEGVAEDSYLKILGLDQWNNNRTDLKVPDGKLDPLSEVFRDDWGLVILPEREPFNSNRVFVDANGVQSDTLIEKVPTIYSYKSSTEKLEDSKYYLQISTKARSSTIRLGRANVIEGSERVTLNGRQLSRGTEYEISYDMGQVTLLTDEATDPNADVQVEFQYAPFMALQKKTLLGMRFEYARSEDLKFGSTVLYKSDKAQERKPRVGQETAKASVMDFDISFGLHPQFLTKMIDALPLINTEAESKLRVTAEVAQSRPNPNVDGEAYLDDFESAVEIQSLGTIRTNWTLSSEPVQVESSPETWTRGTIRWHNPPAISRDEVYDSETAAGQGALYPLRLIFRPHGYKYAGGSQDPCSVSLPSMSWGGIIRSFANRLDEKRIQLFEIRAKGGKGVLHFDFGHISDDVNGNGKYDDEDQSYPKNNTLDVDLDKGINEDIGLDLTKDADEFDDCNRAYNSVTNPDPAGDDWWYEGHGKGAGNDNSRPPVPEDVWTSPGYQAKVNDADNWMHYEWQNGTEGNIDDDVVQGLPDKEALLLGIFEENNAYFTFELPLDTAIASAQGILVPGSGRNGWYTYRVPIREPDVLDTISDGRDVSWSTVTHVRVWFEKDTVAVDSMASMDSVWIADWGFVQSNWQDTLRAQPLDTLSKFYLASVTEDNGTFTPPPGVEPYVDKVSNVTETQKGLALVYGQLQPGAEGIAQKDLLSAESYSGYKRMEMYVHGDSTLSPSDSLMLYFRLGRDTVNYYEYRTYLSPGWSPGNYVLINFDEMTALKDEADRISKERKTPLEDSTTIYRVVGRPNINEVRFMSVSVKNHSHTPHTGQIWLDELRVSDVRKDVGMAARITASGSLADLAAYNVSYEHRDAYFRGLSQATRGGSSNNLGSGQESNSLSFGTSTELGKFLPRSWGARLPVSYSYSTSNSIPLLRSNSDVVLPPETRKEEESISRSVKVTVSEAFARKGSNILYNAFLNRQKVVFSYTRSRQKTVNNPMVFAETYNFRAEYDMGVAKPPQLAIFSWAKSIPLLKKVDQTKLGLYPNKWRWNATFSRSLQVREDVDLNRTSSYSRTLDGRMDFGYKLFENLNLDFNMVTKRDLTDPELVNLSFRRPKLGLEKSYSQSLSTSYAPKIFNFLTTSLSYSATYSDSYDHSSQSRSSSLTRNWSLSGDFKHLMLLGSGRKRAPSGRGGAGKGSIKPPVPGEDGKEDEGGSPFYTPVISGLRFLTKWLMPFRYKYTEGMSRSLPGVKDKLPWSYRLGFNTGREFPMVSTRRNPSAGENNSFELGSGFTLLGGITTSVGYKTNASRNTMTVGTDRTETVNTSWPELSIQIKRFTTLPLIKRYVNWFIDVFTPRTSYSRQIREVHNLDNGFVLNRGKTINRSPLLSVSFKLFQRLSLSGSYGYSIAIEERTDRFTGLSESESRNTKKTAAVSVKYAFSAPTGISIPLFGKMKFKSMVTIDFNVQYGSTRAERSELGGPYVIFTDNSNFSASPIISYTFSNQIRGGMTVRWQDSNDLQRHRKSHVREVQLWTEINF